MDGFKPCPFCGKTDNVTIDDENIYDKVIRRFKEVKFSDGILSISCKRCHLDFMTYVPFDVDYEEAVEIAKEKWNTREVSE